MGSNFSILCRHVSSALCPPAFDSEIDFSAHLWRMSQFLKYISTRDEQEERMFACWTIHCRTVFGSCEREANSLTHYVTLCFLKKSLFPLSKTSWKQDNLQGMRESISWLTLAMKKTKKRKEKTTADGWRFCVHNQSSVSEMTWYEMTILGISPLTGVLVT